MGLLELKAFLKSHTNHTKPLLPTWVYETTSGCCNWEWVNCSTNTGHVINLTLSSINEEQDDGMGTWFFNVSLLQPFKELRILDLSDNGIAGWLGNEGTWDLAPTIIHPTPKTHTHHKRTLCLIGKAWEHGKIRLNIPNQVKNIIVCHLFSIWLIKFILEEESF